MRSLRVCILNDKGVQVPTPLPLLLDLSILSVEDLRFLFCLKVVLFAFGSLTPDFVWISHLEKV